MFESDGLTLEQKFNLRSFESQVNRMSREQAQDFLIKLYEQMIMRENMYKHFLKQQWGLEAGSQLDQDRFEFEGDLPLLLISLQKKAGDAGAQLKAFSLKFLSIQTIGAMKPSDQKFLAFSYSHSIINSTEFVFIDFLSF